MESIRERFLDACDKIISWGLAKNYKDIAQQAGLSVSMMTEIRKGRAQPGNNSIQKFVKTFYQVSLNWLITGEGKMSTLQNSFSFGDDLSKVELDITDQTEIKYLKLDPFNKVGLIPHVALPFYSSFLNNIDHESVIDALPRYPILINTLEGFALMADHLAFTVYDDSLVSKEIPINRGEILITKQRRWHDHSKNQDETFVIVTKDNVLFRQITAKEDTSQLSLRSPNADKEKYPDIDVDRSTILRLYEVIRVINERNLEA